MDFLQVALIFLIFLLSIFLTITGFQVFFILRDLKKALDRLNAVLQTGENIAADIEKPLSVVSSAAQALGKVLKRKPKPRRFYKKTL